MCSASVLRKNGSAPTSTVALLTPYGTYLGLLQPRLPLHSAARLSLRLQVPSEGVDDEASQVFGVDVLEGLVRREDSESADERGAEGQVGESGQDGVL